MPQLSSSSSPTSEAAPHHLKGQNIHGPILSRTVGIFHHAHGHWDCHLRCLSFHPVVTSWKQAVARVLLFSKLFNTIQRGMVFSDKYKVMIYVYVNSFTDKHDIVAEWSKALHLGCSLRWRRFKSCRCHFLPGVTKLHKPNIHIDFYHSV